MSARHSPLHISTYPSDPLSVYLSIYLSINLSIYVAGQVRICLLIDLLICLFSKIFYISHASTHVDCYKYRNIYAWTGRHIIQTYNSKIGKRLDACFVNLAWSYLRSQETAKWQSNAEKQAVYQNCVKKGQTPSSGDNLYTVAILQDVSLFRYNNVMDVQKKRVIYPDQWKWSKYKHAL